MPLLLVAMASNQLPTSQAKSCDKNPQEESTLTRCSFAGIGIEDVETLKSMDEGRTELNAKGTSSSASSMFNISFESICRMFRRGQKQLVQLATRFAENVAKDEVGSDKHSMSRPNRKNTVWTRKNVQSSESVSHRFPRQKPFCV